MFRNGIYKKNQKNCKAYNLMVTPIGNNNLILQRYFIETCNNRRDVIYMAPNMLTLRCDLCILIIDATVPDLRKKMGSGYQVVLKHIKLSV